MLNPSEVATGVSAAWRVFLGRPHPLDGLDMTVEGFWRSFLAPLLALPLYVLHVMAEHRLILDMLPEGAAIEEAVFALSRTVGFLADLAAFPLLMAFLARPLGIGRAYVPLIVIFNWTAPLIAVPLSLPSILLGTGMLGPEPATLLLLVALVLAIAWRYRAARAALGGLPAMAAGLVALDFLLSIVLSQTISRIAGV
ncbi:hypothetical protein [Lutibaculum baratangense]|uniref:Putative transmembrane protein n=1 Tax=Lutibaculum baratangense AMV1 TaxID=631454 RepID=V4RVB7_9HYPH|nr:hypothetical protein [Lutibaculum baratangense]ESR26985.1 putative transmembrane protein [Lutibaculum baratangense AMV1]